MTSGADAITGEEECREIAAKAQAVFAVGTCSSFGGVQAAKPKPTHSVGVDTFLPQKVVNIPGCPPSEANIIDSLMYFILFNELPELDNLNRPLWSYGKNLHNLCERKAKFESGDFAQSFDDPHLKDGYCLYKVGCKGPYVTNNCPKVKFNAKTSWSIRAGHGCIACSEPDFEIASVALKSHSTTQMLTCTRAKHGRISRESIKMKVLSPMVRLSLLFAAMNPRVSIKKPLLQTHRIRKKMQIQNLQISCNVVCRHIFLRF